MNLDKTEKYEYSALLYLVNGKERYEVLNQEEMDNLDFILHRANSILVLKRLTPRGHEITRYYNGDHIVQCTIERIPVR